MVQGPLDSDTATLVHRDVTSHLLLTNGSPEAALTGEQRADEHSDLVLLELRRTHA
ncbi:hypothetical protein Sgleb_04650 [Streptomyces glebosus]|uniref:Uncharacterized protein n=1 Tax=Streptomyces glebosus TaxID=249580 RepID=A0A640SMV7_9ACTN|nr:hypothetical protein Sgleb_04650 [Streptomyces glebosus]GHG82841.1 hypothetical protein GCM10010513_62020 [Streptomyces glebosus]